MLQFLYSVSDSALQFYHTLGCHDKTKQRNIFPKRFCYNLAQNIVEKFRKFSKIGLSMKCFRAVFLQFSSGTFRISFQQLVGHLITFFNYKYFLKCTNFLRPIKTEVACQVVWQLLHHFLVIIIQFLFIQGEEKLCLNMKKSSTILPKIVRRDKMP